MNINEHDLQWIKHTEIYKLKARNQCTEAEWLVRFLCGHINLGKIHSSAIKWYCFATIIMLTSIF
jgi:hypothetical protein